MENIQNYLNSLWTGIIENHAFDIFNHSIKFDIKVISNEEEVYHQLRFNNVKAFYYLNDQPPFEPEDDDYLELTAITFLKEKTKQIKVSCGSSEYSHLSTKTNFSLEIWGREMIIEASVVEIDGKFFDVGFSE
ncbi:YxiG family protein [Paenibacillus sp. S28]|uniref:YxiG family protein n=1 Tax=Paenibacillus sp. S28 TaxID=2767463 RepID=UPI00190BA082|nr:hypothetical protein [Paenibacillus sp. S28]MBJ9991027.1 hypothetical protein [Paenibacillus sp. S28]